MKNRSMIVVAVALAVAQTPAMAQQTRLPAIEVQGADHDSDKLIRCGYSYTTAVEEAKATLRYNRIDIGSDGPGVPTLWIALDAVTPRFTSGEYDSHCNLWIEVSMRQWVYSIIGNQQDYVGFGELMLCEKSGYVYRKRGDIASTATSFVRDFVNQCISEATRRYRNAHGR